MTFAEPTLGIDDVVYTVGDTLGVDAVIVNDGNARTVTCYVALYNGNKLEVCHAEEIDFAENEYTHEFDWDAGAVSAGMNVKVMLWNADSTKPVCAIGPEYK